MTTKSKLLHVLLGALLAIAVVGAEDNKPPTLTPAQRETIRKFQLDDQRLDSAIKQRQLEIVQAQQQQQANAKQFQAFVANVCGDKFIFDQASDELRCVAKPTPTPTPEKKK